VEIKFQKLGKTKIEITPIGLGVWQFAGGSGFTKFVWPTTISHQDGIEILENALKGGINWFDTAEAYGRGQSEQLLAAGLQELEKKDEEVIIATKWFPLFRTSRSIKKTIDTRIDKLSPYSIDLHQIHQPWALSSLNGQMKAMSELVDIGKIKAIGVSNFSADSMRKAESFLTIKGHTLASNQVRYSLLDRRIENNGVLDAAKELGITIIAYSPLAMGLLSGKFHENEDLIKTRPFARRRMFKRKLEKSKPLIEEMEKIATNHKATMAQVALNWLINYSGNTVVAIPGASKASHAEESANSMKFQLSKTEMQDIDDLSKE
jgi:aryl-alcohol dehydrogenase-like predicted oxidoreductase